MFELVTSLRTYRLNIDADAALNRPQKLLDSKPLERVSKLPERIPPVDVFDDDPFRGDSHGLGPQKIHFYQLGQGWFRILFFQDCQRIRWLSRAVVQILGGYRPDRS